MWAGGIIIALTIIVSGLSGLYSDYSFCKNIEKASLEDIRNMPTQETTITAFPSDYLKNFEIRMKCNSVSNNIFMSYLTIIIGVALVVGGFITRK